MSEIAMVWLLCNLRPEKMPCLLCLKCNDVAQPRHCTTVVEYPQFQFSRCTHCCDSKLCNNQACGEPGYPSDRGPICYSCHKSVPAGRCHNIDFCRKGEVVCDMDTDGGGWTVFQNRFNGSVDFYRNFSSYEDGNGLTLMHEMMSQTTHELRIDIERANGTLAYVVYPEFMIDAAPTYIMRIENSTDYDGISSTEADYLTDIDYGGAVNMSFSTFDRDNDLYGGNCASTYHGAWWYNMCYTYANLNVDYLTPGNSSNRAMSFDSHESLETSRMMFRTM
ncbi:ficolin-2-like [Mya arenaria]|uniref:ficolin-2-like n=1 Tax=Mya arenaria TaxID=6604 RepID=UPI0022E45985|nr:ficolin-2-like [Mya arenaria]